MTEQDRHIRRTAAICAGIALTMIGLAFASVPLYALFCKVTGYDGTPLIALSAPARSLDRTIAVRFDANVSPGLDWRFTPEQNEIVVRLGEPVTALYKVKNEGTSTATGIATFNVQPELAGGYFNKIQCFCFTEHTLKPGESMESAVLFYIDPDIVKDRDIQRLSTITLSYTYFPAKAAKTAARE